FKRPRRNMWSDFRNPVYCYIAVSADSATIQRLVDTPSPRSAHASHLHRLGSDHRLSAGEPGDWDLLPAAGERQHRGIFRFWARRLVVAGWHLDGRNNFGS